MGDVGTHHMGYGAIYQFVMMFPDRVVSEVEVSWDSIKCVRSSERSERAMPGVVRDVCVRHPLR